MLHYLVKTLLIIIFEFLVHYIIYAYIFLAWLNWTSRVFIVIFLYIICYKGYKCYTLASSRIYIPHYVIFDELTFTFDLESSH